MNKRGIKIYLVYGVIFFLILGTIFIFRTNLTGLIVYEEQTVQKEWDFTDLAEYVYDDALLNLSSGEIKLIPEITINNWTTEENTELTPTTATLNNPGNTLHDKTSEVESIDDEFVNLNQDDAFLEINFANDVENENVISLYILQGNNVQADVYLCTEGNCAYPGYGAFNFAGESGWYDLTITGLSSPTNSLAINHLTPGTPKNIKIDQVKTVVMETVEHSNTSTTHPSSAELETVDLEIENLVSFGTFTSEETLNNQVINYQYSVDSGVSWEDLPEDGDL
ncbi:MAG: hypothetical protein KJ771_01420, partial [Nanoarchaeota archaeon]|nr:hypothetical protein [Nanoarchaeota archaeon]